MRGYVATRRHSAVQMEIVLGTSINTGKRVYAHFCLRPEKIDPYTLVGICKRIYSIALELALEAVQV